MLEAAHEKKVCEHIVEHGGLAIKIKGLKGFPDRLIITHTGYVYFLEMKKPDGNLMKYQLYIHKALRRLKQDVRTAYSYEEAINQYDKICSKKVSRKNN